MNMELEKLRTEVRNWLVANAPKDWREAATHEVFVAGQRDFDTFMRQCAQNTVHVVEERVGWMQVNVDHARAPRIPTWRQRHN